MGGLVRRIFVSIVASAMLAAQPACAQDDGDEDEKPEALVSVDLLATYFKASGFSLGFGVPRLSTLTLTSPSSSSFTVDAPLKVEFDGWFRLYAGLGGAMESPGSGSWTSFKPDNWKTGFSADVITQAEGQWMPTVTVTGSMTRPLDQVLIQTTTWTAGLDLDLAVDVEQTRGLLAGVGYTRVTLDRAIGIIRPATLLYAGAYRQFGDWKLSATGGVQLFDGAQVGNLIRVAPVDIKFVRAELEKLDDDDNRLMAVAVAVGWSPKASVQLTLNVPLYVNR